MLCLSVTQCLCFCDCGNFQVYLFSDICLCPTVDYFTVYILSVDLVYIGECAWSCLRNVNCQKKSVSESSRGM